MSSFVFTAIDTLKKNVKKEQRFLDTMESEGSNGFINSIESCQYGKKWRSDFIDESTLGDGQWNSIAASASGKFVTVGSYNGSLFSSNTFGRGWTVVGDKLNWNFVAMSSSGKYQVACAWEDYLYLSSDFGATFTKIDNCLLNRKKRKWTGCVISQTGKHITAVADCGHIYISSDFGICWEKRQCHKHWNAVSMSSTGEHQTAVATGCEGGIYISNNYGHCWEQSDAPNDTNWYAVSVSGSGKHQTAVVNDGESGDIYISQNYGQCWHVKDFDNPSQYWTAVSVSETGKYQTATAYSTSDSPTGKVWISKDFGDCWHEVCPLGNANWTGAWVSPSGQWQYVVDALGNFQICVTQNNGGSILASSKCPPEDPSPGQLYFDEHCRKIKVYTGCEWRELKYECD